MAEAKYGSVTFTEQINFLRRKSNITTTHWADIYTHEHDWAFIVAGANRDAIVADFRAAVEKTIEQGGTLEGFRKDFDAIVAKHGWDYNGGRNWRSRVIYETNLYSSYNAGRFEQLQNDRDALPYWQYHHNDSVKHPRPHHLSWDGIILPADHPWWETHFAPNGWGCKCTITGLSEYDMEQQGISVSPDPEVKMQEVEIGQRSPDGPRTVVVPEGIDPGFEYTPGRARLQSAIPPERPFGNSPGSANAPGLPNTLSKDQLPAPRRVSDDLLLADNLSEEKYANAFLHKFGADIDHPAIVMDVTGERLAVGRDLFWNRTEGKLKANKNGRGKYMLILAEALKDPDEIWTRIEWHYTTNKAVVRRRYIAQFEIPNKKTPAVAVFEMGADGWSGITVHTAHNIDKLRVGVRTYKRAE